MGKLINRIPGSRFFISSLPGLALRTHVEWLGLAMSTSILKDLPGKLDIKRHSPSILYILASTCYFSTYQIGIQGMIKPGWANVQTAKTFTACIHNTDM